MCFCVCVQVHGVCVSGMFCSLFNEEIREDFHTHQSLIKLPFHVVALSNYRTKHYRLL